MADRASKRRRLSHRPVVPQTERGRSTPRIPRDPIPAPSQNDDETPGDSSDERSFDGLSDSGSGNLDGEGPEGATSDDEIFDTEEEEDEVEAEQQTQQVKDTKQPTRQRPSRLPSSRSDTAGGTATGRMDLSHTSLAADTNLFALQTAELIKALELRHGSREDSVNDILRDLKSRIEALPAHEPALPATAEHSLRKRLGVSVPAPYAWANRDVQYKLGYAKPAAINVIGSYALNTAIRDREDTFAVDMVIMMPSSLFSEKDYLNNRYLHKRAFYLAYIAGHLQREKIAGVRVGYACQNGNPLLPIITLEGATDHDTLAKAGCRINILASAADSSFPTSKILPTRNCLRDSNQEAGEMSTQPPTPFYNGSLRASTTSIDYLKLLHGAGVKCASFRDACVLGRTWLRQRGFDGSLQGGGYGNFEMSAFMALLLQGGAPSGKPILSTAYDARQLFKATLNFLAQRDLLKQPLEVGERPVGVLKQAGAPMLFDGNRMHNILFKMTSSSYRALRTQAQLSLKILRSNGSDAFEKMFIIKESEPLLSYDLIVQAACPKGFASASEQRDYLRDVEQTFRRGFGDRAVRIDTRPCNPSSWSINKSTPESLHDSSVTVCLSLNAGNAARTVDRGPSVEDKAASSAFAAFWGEKAELRRFKDGSILHSVVWSSSGALSLAREIARFLLQKVGMEESSASMTAFEDWPGKVSKDVSMHPTTASFDGILTAFDGMEKQIRALADLPLSVRQISPASSLLSCSKSLAGRRVADVVLQLEGSGRWPDDLNAIQMTKAAFLLNLEHSLSAADESLVARVGIENHGQQFMNRTFLDISYEPHATFRLRIHHDREATLLQQLLASKSTLPSARLAAASALSVHKRANMQRPLHTQAIRSMATRFPAFSTTARLVKQWFASHLLSPHFDEALLELMAAKAFVEPEPWLPPASAQTGFLRTLLLLSRWDWARTPLVVDLAAGGASGGSMDAHAVKSIHTRFEAWRQLDPRMNRVAVFGASNVDAEGNTWTDNARPSRMAATRMSALAKAAVEVTRARGMQLDPASLFKRRLSDYDFLMHIKSSFANSGDRRSKKSSVYKNLSMQTEAESDGDSPVDLFVNEAESLLGDAAVLFYDQSRKDVVAGLWNPQATSRRWKVNLPYSTVVVLHRSGAELADDDAGAAPNKQAMLAEVARLGGDMIARVEHRS